MDGEAWLCCSPWGCEESDTTEQLPFHFSLSCIGEGNGNPLQCSCLENPRDEGAWWAAVYGVAQSRTRLKRLSSSSIRIMVAHWVRKYSLCFYLLKEIVESCHNFILKCLDNSHMKPSMPGALCFGKLLIVDDISVIDIGHSHCIFFLWAFSHMKDLTCIFQGLVYFL